MKVLIGAHATVLGGAAFVLLDTVRALKPKYEVQVVIPAAEGPLYPELLRLGVKIHILSRKHWIPFPSAPFESDEVNTLQQLLSDEHIGLTISNTAIVASLALAAARAGVPHIWYIHEALASNINVYPIIGPARCFTTITELSARVFTSSLNVLQEFLDYLPRESRIACKESSTLNVLHPALRDEFTVDNVVRQQKFKRFTAICCGVQSFNKGVDKLVLAADRIRKEIPSFQLLLVGMPGDATGFIVGAISRLRLKDTVRILPHSNDLQDLIPRAHLAIYPSIRESFGLSMLEAAASGIPVLATRSGGSKEVLEHFPATIWLASCAEDEIHKKVIGLRHHYDEADTLARQSAPGIAARFSYARFENELLDHIDEVKQLPPARRISTLFRVMEDPFIHEDSSALKSNLADIEYMSPTDSQCAGERKGITQFILNEIYSYCFERKTGFEDCSVLVMDDSSGACTLHLAAAGLDVIYTGIPDSASYEMTTRCFAKREELACRITVAGDISNINRAVDFVVCLSVHGKDILPVILPSLTAGNLVFLCDYPGIDVRGFQNLMGSHQFSVKGKVGWGFCWEKARGQP